MWHFSRTEATCASKKTSAVQFLEDISPKEPFFCYEDWIKLIQSYGTREDLALGFGVVLRFG